MAAGNAAAFGQWRHGMRGGGVGSGQHRALKQSSSIITIVISSIYSKLSFTTRTSAFDILNELI